MVGISEAKDRVCRWLPSNTQLLHVNHTICLNNLVNQSSDLVFIHGPDLIKAILIRLLKALELVLEFTELLGELLVVFGKLHVVLLVVLGLGFELVFNCTQDVFVAAILVFKTIDSIGIHFFTLFEHFVIKFQFLFVQSVDSFHVFHALFEDLHFLFKLDFLLSLIISILGS